MKIKHLWGNKNFRRSCIAVLCVLVAIAIVWAACNVIVLQSTASRRFTAETFAEEDMQPFDCILVLGAKVNGNELSQVLRDRMDTGLQLYADGYSQLLLLSGDSASPEQYDETGAMAAYAVSAGVAESGIQQDPLGLSTYESIWRAKHVYGVSRILVVTQAFHLPRALYYADMLGIECVGVSCDARLYYPRNYVRESLARVKAVLDGFAKTED